jgi:uncharacterized protein YggL (DUF469 family)
MPIIRNRHFKTKRLRKKYHQGEFKQLGFDLEASFIEPHPEGIERNEQSEAWLSKNVFDGGLEKVLCFMDSIGLEYGGGSNDKNIQFFVCKYKGSCTIEDTQKVAEFIKGTGVFKDVVVGPLKDAWYE